MSLRSLFARRLLQVIPVLVGIMLITFLLVRLLPGDPARQVVGIRATPQQVAQERDRLGLDDPLPVQYLRYVGNIAHGDLGQSLIARDDVSQVIRNRLPATLLLLALAIVLALALGIPLAVVSALRRDRAPDLAIRSALVVGLGVPSFVLGLLLVTYPGLKWGLLPSGGYGEGFAEHLRHLILPALTLALTFLAVMTRSLRASVLEVLQSDHVALARLKGLGQRRLMSRHILRNALGPAVTIVGLNASFLLGNAVIVERVFAVEGIGSALVNAITRRDFLVVQGITLVFGLLVVLISLAVDLIQAALDPRITS